MSTTAGARLDGALIIVTGVAARGQLGETVARAFGDRGASLALLDRDADGVRARAAELRALGIDATAWPCDLTDPVALAQVARDLEARAPAGVATLACLAGGFALSGPVAESDPDAWPRQFAINLTTAYLATRAFLPLLRRGRGRIVYVASAAATPGASRAGIAAYAAAKSAVVSLMQSVAQEERAHGVVANALAPTAIRTDANLAAMGASDGMLDRAVLAEWIVFLGSPASGAVTGQLIGLGT